MRRSQSRLVKDLVDIFEPTRRDRRVHLAVGGQIDHLLQVEPGADDGAPHRDAVEYKAEYIERENRPATGRPGPASGTGTSSIVSGWRNAPTAAAFMARAIKSLFFRNVYDQKSGRHRVMPAAQGSDQKKPSFFGL